MSLMGMPTPPLESDDDGAERIAFASKDERILDKAFFDAAQDELEPVAEAYYDLVHLDIHNHPFSSMLLLNHWGPPHELVPWPNSTNIPQLFINPAKWQQRLKICLANNERLAIPWNEQLMLPLPDAAVMARSVLYFPASAAYTPKSFVFHGVSEPAIIEGRVDFSTLTPFDAQYLTEADFTKAELAAQGHPERMTHPVYSPNNSRPQNGHQRHTKEQKSQVNDTQVDSRVGSKSQPELQPLYQVQTDLRAPPTPPNHQDLGTHSARSPVYHTRRHDNIGFRGHHPASRRWLARSRGVFVRCVPKNATLSDIFANIRGGVVERVTIQPTGERKDVNVFFVSPEGASSYRGFVQRNGGIYWGGEQNRHALPSFAGLVNPHFGGHLRMKESMEKAVEDGATRCLEISGLPPGITKEKILRDIDSQHIVREVEYESFVLYKDRSSYGHPSVRATIKFTSIGMALGVKQFFTRLPEYHGAFISFIADPCAGPMSELADKWKREHNETIHSSGQRAVQSFLQKRWRP